MPYIATRHFKQIPKGTDHVREYRPGDAVLDFESWPDLAQRSHLNQGLVKQIDAATAKDAADDTDAAEPPKGKRGRKPKPTAEGVVSDDDELPPFIRTKEHEQAEEQHLPPAVLK